MKLADQLLESTLTDHPSKKSDIYLLRKNIVRRLEKNKSIDNDRASFLLN